MENENLCNSIIGYHNATKFCTCHNSTAVRTCAKFHSNHFTILISDFYNFDDRKMKFQSNLRLWLKNRLWNGPLDSLYNLTAYSRATTEVEIRMILQPSFLTLHSQFFQSKHKHIALHWHDAGSWNPSLCKARIYLFYIVNIMIFTMLNQINSVLTC